MVNHRALASDGRRHNLGLYPGADLIWLGALAGAGLLHLRRPTAQLRFCLSGPGPVLSRVASHPATGLIGRTRRYRDAPRREFSVHRLNSSRTDAGVNSTANRTVRRSPALPNALARHLLGSPFRVTRQSLPIAVAGSCFAGTRDEGLLRASTVRRRACRPTRNLSKTMSEDHPRHGIRNSEFEFRIRNSEHQIRVRNSPGFQTDVRRVARREPDRELPDRAFGVRPGRFVTPPKDAANRRRLREPGAAKSRTAKPWRGSVGLRTATRLAVAMSNESSVRLSRPHFASVDLSRLGPASVGGRTVGGPTVLHGRRRSPGRVLTPLTDGANQHRRHEPRLQKVEPPDPGEDLAVAMSNES